MIITNLCCIGSRLREARKRKKLTQAQHAEMVDRSITHVGLIERGK